jgi:post-segregation antitoxin (ccd killing protein)
VELLEEIKAIDIKIDEVLKTPIQKELSNKVQSVKMIEEKK